MVSSRRLEPRVAIAMAVHDDERYLALALDALCAQRFRDFHLTVWDDGSSDGSAAVAEGYAGRLPIAVIRGAHRGRHFAKQAAWSHALPAPYLLVLDSDVALPPEALERMAAALDGDPGIAAVSAQARSFTGRPFGAAQAFMEDLFFASNGDATGNGRWIVGGCVLLRRSALEGLEVRADVGEDNDLSEKLRARWRIVVPQDLVATHYGVPTTLAGVLRRFYRDGVRVRALLRAYPSARQLGNVARLAPLPLCLAGMAGAAALQPWVAAGAGALLAGYAAAFLAASRRVPARLADRLAGALTFTVGNVAFGLGYLREALRGHAAVMREPARPS